jgi:hypothetical protein
MIQPLINRSIPAEVLTSNHYIFGQIKVTNTGLMGVLSDTNFSYVEVNDASMARILKPDKITDYAPVMWIVKSQLTAVSLSKPDYVGSASLVRGGYTRFSQYPVRLTTPVYEISGTLEWAGRLDFSVVMGEGSNAFLILYDAVVSATLFPALHLECPALLLNRRIVDSMVYQKKTTQETTSSM